MRSSTSSSSETPWLPTHGKKVMITVIHKRGDVRNPENHRPICGLPQLYIHFFTVLFNGLHAELDRYQCPEQAAFRKTFQTSDHIMTYKHILPVKQRVRVGHVGGSDRLQDGIRFKTACSNLEIPQKSFGQRTIHLPHENCTLINAPPY